MRNYRLFGVVTAVLLGPIALHQPPSSPHHDHQHLAGTHLGGTGIELASATVPADRTLTPLALGEESPVGLLRPAGTRYVKLLYAWVGYEKAHAPPPPLPPQAQKAQKAPKAKPIAVV